MSIELSAELIEASSEVTRVCGGQSSGRLDDELGHMSFMLCCSNTTAAVVQQLDELNIQRTIHLDRTSWSKSDYIWGKTDWQKT